MKKAFFIGLSSGPHYFDMKKITKTTDFYRYFHRGGFVELSYERPDLIYARLTKSPNFKTVAPLLNELERRVGK